MNRRGFFAWILSAFVRKPTGAATISAPLTFFQGARVCIVCGSSDVFVSGDRLCCPCDRAGRQHAAILARAAGWSADNSGDTAGKQHDVQARRTTNGHNTIGGPDWRWPIEWPRQVERHVDELFDGPII